MAALELEFDCALLTSSGVAESLDAAGADARVGSHDDADAHLDDEPPWPDRSA